MYVHTYIQCLKHINRYTKIARFFSKQKIRRKQNMTKNFEEVLIQNHMPLKTVSRGI